MSAAETIQIQRVEYSPFWPSFQALSRYLVFLFEKNLDNGRNSLESVGQNDICFYKDNLGTRLGTKKLWNNVMGDDSFISSQAGIHGYSEASLRAKVNLSDLPSWDFLDCNVERKISPDTWLGGPRVRNIGHKDFQNRENLGIVRISLW